MKAKTTSSIRWYDRRAASAGFGLVSLALAYILLLRALFTGSLQQYGLALILVSFAINRLIFAIKRRHSL